MYGKTAPNFFAAKAITLWAGLILIISGFYTYRGILGKGWDPVDIALFVIGAAASWLCSHRMLKKERFSSRRANALGLAAMALTVFCFWAFTFVPPRIPLFRDSVTGTFGIWQR
ncbi:MAG: DUF6512 family protein [Christensenellales bacterium]